MTMIYYPPASSKVLAICTYGSHLYGTNTETSDYDFKVVTLPKYRDLLFARKLMVERFRFDASGNTIGDNMAMPANGWEAEHIPVQKFVQDYLSGQAYAIEFAFAVLQGYHTKHICNGSEFKRAADLVQLARTLVNKFQHQNVCAMISFATKQTFDYVHRGERLNAARSLLPAIDSIPLPYEVVQAPIRLNTFMPQEKISVLQFLANSCNLQIGTLTNNNLTLSTLELNGRSYMENTTLVNLRTAVLALILKYGDRSIAAAETNVEWKSLSHAVRVYQQVLEYLETGWITFPRPNAENLLKIKLGVHSLHSVRDLLRELELQVQEALAVSTLPVLDAAMQQRLDDVMYEWLDLQY